jgi:hypothetical protein
MCGVWTDRGGRGGVALTFAEERPLLGGVGHKSAVVVAPRKRFKEEDEHLEKHIKRKLARARAPHTGSLCGLASTPFMYY